MIIKLYHSRRTYQPYDAGATSTNASLSTRPITLLTNAHYWLAQCIGIKSSHCLNIYKAINQQTRTRYQPDPMKGDRVRWHALSTYPRYQCRKMFAKYPSPLLLQVWNFYFIEFRALGRIPFPLLISEAFVHTLPYSQTKTE